LSSLIFQLIYFSNFKLCSSPSLLSLEIPKLNHIRL
jgi:hypothetical protein